MTEQAAQPLQFSELLNFSWPKINSVTIENVSYKDETVEGDVKVQYSFNGNHSITEHFKTKINDEEDIPIEPLIAKLHVWIQGPKLWLGIRLCIGSLCSPEGQTSVDLPH